MRAGQKGSSTNTQRKSTLRDGEAEAESVSGAPPKPGSRPVFPILHEFVTNDCLPTISEEFVKEHDGKNGARLCGSFISIHLPALGSPGH